MIQGTRPRTTAVGLTDSPAGLAAWIVEADWDRARDMHVELAKAAGTKPRTRALLTDACRGQANVRWIERYGEVPDGPSVGEPFRLLEFQREVIRGIYSDPSYWAAVNLVVKKKRAA
jgi:hypothetical protein